MPVKEKVQELLLWVYGERKEDVDRRVEEQEEKIRGRRPPGVTEARSERYRASDFDDFLP